MKKLLAFFLSIGIIIAVYAVLNGGFIGIQRVFKQDEIKELEMLEESLIIEEEKLEDDENKLVDIDNRIVSRKEGLMDIENQIKEFEELFPNGIPEKDYEDYSSLVDLYEEALIKYNTTLYIRDREYEEYNDSVTEFNKKVKEAERLAKKVGEQWVIMPLGRVIK